MFVVCCSLMYSGFLNFTLALCFLIPHELHNEKEISVECFLYTVLKCTQELKSISFLDLGAGMPAQPQWSAHFCKSSGKNKILHGYVFFNYQGFNTEIVVHLLFSQQLSYRFILLFSMRCHGCFSYQPLHSWTVIASSEGLWQETHISSLSVLSLTALLKDEIISNAFPQTCNSQINSDTLLVQLSLT